MCAALQAAGCVSLLPGVCWAQACPGQGRWRWGARGRGQASLGPGPDTRGPGQGARPRCRSGRSPARRPPPLPLLQTFSQLPDLLRSAPRSASLMNYSAARAPISAPRPPSRAVAGGVGELPPPPARPSLPARRRPTQSPARPSPSPPGPRRSLPPSRSAPRLALTLPAGAERTRPGGTSSATPGRGGDRERPAHPQQPAGAGPRGPGGTPTPATSSSAPARRGRCQDAPRLVVCARGGDAGPHLGAAARCPARPHGPALRAPSESRAGSRRPPAPAGVQTWGG